MITPAFTSNMHQIVRCERESTPTGYPIVLWRATRFFCIGREWYSSSYCPSTHPSIHPFIHPSAPASYNSHQHVDGTPCLFSPCLQTLPVAIALVHWVGIEECCVHFPQVQYVFSKAHFHNLHFLVPLLCRLFVMASSVFTVTVSNRQPRAYVLERCDVITLDDLSQWESPMF